MAEVLKQRKRERGARPGAGRLLAGAALLPLALGTGGAKTLAPGWAKTLAPGWAKTLAPGWAKTLAAGWAGAQAPSGASPKTALPPAPPATPATYRRLAGEAEASYQRDVLAAWFPRALDYGRGGFYQNYDAQWRRGPNNDKALVYQSRLTWVAAQTALRYPRLAAQYAGYARHGVKFLSGTMWDKQNGGFYWGLDNRGFPVRGGEKHAYGIAFGIYAACAAYQATHDQAALDLARRAYVWLDAHAHDGKNGGYYEALTRAGEPILTPPSAAPDAQSDAIGTHYGVKTMNSHIHLLEALTALYEVWPDEGLRTRLAETFAIVRDKVAVAPVGCLNLYFTPDWRALPDHDSFGHDVETAYLLVEASARLGQPEDAPTWFAARRLVDHALAFGWDGENGGFYDTGGVFGPPAVTDKIWWEQAEGLNALLLMHERFGQATGRYWTAFNQQWNFIRAHQIDARNGGWYPTVNRKGVPAPGGVKSDGWTEAYHQGRALLNVSASLRKLASGARSARTP